MYGLDTALEQDPKTVGMDFFKEVERKLKPGLAESGSALRRLMMAPLTKANRVRRFDPVVKKVLKLASELEAAQVMPNPIKLDNISIS